MSPNKKYQDPGNVQGELFNQGQFIIVPETIVPVVPETIDTEVSLDPRAVLGVMEMVGRDRKLDSFLWLGEQALSTRHPMPHQRALIKRYGKEGLSIRSENREAQRKEAQWDAWMDFKQSYIIKSLGGAAIQSLPEAKKPKIDAARDFWLLEKTFFIGEAGESNKVVEAKRRRFRRKLENAIKNSETITLPYASDQS